LTVESDEQWHALCRVIGRDDLAADQSLASAEGRQARHDELDVAVGAWTRDRTDYEAADELQAAGVPASPVVSMTTLPNDPHLAARHFIETVQHAQIGETRVSGTNWREVGPRRPSVREAAPLFGQHNREVLEDILGLSADEIVQLEQEGVTADEPAH